MIVEESLVPAYELPDPLSFEDGSRVTSAAAWRSRRREILDLFAAHVYGATPQLEVTLRAATIAADGPALDGSALRRQTRLTLAMPGGALGIDLLEYLPSRAAAPTPVILVPNFRGNHTVAPDTAILVSQKARRDQPEVASARGVMAHRFPLGAIVARGFRLATFYYGDVVADAADLGGGGHPLFPRGAAGRGQSEWGAVGAWAWGLSRVLDHLLAEAQVDPGRVVVAGHSRLGKAALWAGAQDERFAAVFANDSGCTGAALARRRFGETIAAINALFPHWFCRRYRDYAEREHLLPVDQHQLLAAMAPRPLYVASAADDLWADPRGEFLGAAHAGAAYELLGGRGLAPAEWPPAGPPSGGGIGYHLRPGPHELLAEDWARFLDFIEVALAGRSGARRGQPL